MPNLWSAQNLLSPFVFSGRITRSSFFWYALLVSFALLTVWTWQMAVQNFRTAENFYVYFLSISILLWLFWAAGARRFHDVGISAIVPIVALVATGAMVAIPVIIRISVGVYGEFNDGVAIWGLVLLPLAQLVGAVICAFFWLKSSQPGPNKYGPNPHEAPQ